MGINVFILEDNMDRMEWFYKNMSKLLNTTDYNIIAAKNVDTAKDLWNIWNGEFEFYFLDHDLDDDIYVDIDESNTGSEFAKWLVEQGVKGNNEKIYIHSLNPVGAINMMAKFDKSIRAPYAWLVTELDKM